MADFLRKNAADKIATLEYRWALLAIILVVGLANYYFLVIDKYEGLPGILASLFLGWIVAYLVKILYFSRRLVKQYSEEELRGKWLALGGFSPGD